MQVLIGDQIGQNNMHSVHLETHHFARADSAEPPKGPTWIHFVALHFSPLMVGQLPCRLVLSVSPFGVRLQGSTRVGVLRIELPGVSAGTNLIHGVLKLLWRGCCLHLSPDKGAAGGALLLKQGGSCEVQVPCRKGAPVEQQRVAAAGLHGRSRARALGPARAAHPVLRQREYRLAALLRRRPAHTTAMSGRPLLSHKPWMLTERAVLVVG